MGETERMIGRDRGADRQRKRSREMHRGADREKRDWNIGDKR